MRREQGYDPGPKRQTEEGGGGGEESVEHQQQSTNNLHKQLEECVCLCIVLEVFGEDKHQQF